MSALYMEFGEIRIELVDVVEISMLETMLADKDRRVRFVLTAALAKDSIRN
jgi:hypothetical protein